MFCVLHKPAAMSFWKELLRVMKDINIKQSKVDRSLLQVDGLMFWISWVDDLLRIGSKANVMRFKEEIKNRMECEDTGPMNEYIG
jgi:hypothetical protein